MPIVSDILIGYVIYKKVISNTPNKYNNYTITVNDFLNKNVDKIYHTDIKSAFTSNVKVTTLSKDTIVYRYYGDGAKAKSFWYTPYQTSNPQADLVLPSVNLCTKMGTYTIPKGTTIIEGTVAPNFGQPGGGYQYFVVEPGVVK